MAVKEYSNMVSKAENVLKSIPISQVLILGLLNMIYRLAKSSFYLGLL